MNARQLTGHLLAGAIYKALAPVIPEKIIAECGSAPGLTCVFSGHDRNGNRVSQILFARGGMGASAHGDGHDCTPFPTNAGAGSIEAFEGLAPLVVWRKELCADSGGAGQFRGGMGQELEIEIVSDTPMRMSMLSDRRHHPAQGFLGGQPGAALTLSAVGRHGAAPEIAHASCKPGERLTMKLSGGGGFGDPARRDPDAVRRRRAQRLCVGRGGPARLRILPETEPWIGTPRNSIRSPWKSCGAG